MRNNETSGTPVFVNNTNFFLQLPSTPETAGEDYVINIEEGTLIPMETSGPAPEGCNGCQVTGEFDPKNLAGFAVALALWMRSLTRRRREKVLIQKD